MPSHSAGCFTFELPDLRRGEVGVPASNRAVERQPGSWETGARLVGASDPTRVARVRADAERHASRLFANALVNVAWRNGPVENVHAGRARNYPLGQRRVTPTEEGEVIRIASEGMAMGMTVCLQLAMERPRRLWAEQVLPFGLAHMWLVTPSGWTLTETSHGVRLPSPGQPPRAD